jgi:F5/8 type C domain
MIARLALCTIVFALTVTATSIAHPTASSGVGAARSQTRNARRPGTTYAVTVDAANGHAIGSFDPLRALGAGVDAQNAGAVSKIYTPANVAEMTSSGLGEVTYRLYTELSVQDWHWNPTGTWSLNGNQGYWTGATAGSSPPITDSFGYRLPHRGNTRDQGNNDDYSRLDDGDASTYWESNPYLDTLFTGGSSSNPQWVVIDLGRKRGVDAVQIDWSLPYAFVYQVQYWTGSDAINNPAGGKWVTFPAGSVTSGKGGLVTLQFDSSPRPVRFVRILMSSSSLSVILTVIRTPATVSALRSPRSASERSPAAPSKTS